MTTHPFDQAIHLTPTSPGVYSGTSAAAYWNMVGPFGGITAATVMNAVMTHPDRLGEPVALTVNFAGPIAAGAFTLTARARRTNRSTQHWLIELLQPNAQGEEEVMLTATAVTAVRRSTWGQSDSPMPQVPPPDELPPVQGMNQMAWVARYDLRFAEGAFPEAWDGSGEASLTRLWMRDEPARALDFCSLAALADLFYPRVYLRRALRVPAGTVSMTVYFHAGTAELQASGRGFLLGQAQAQAFRNGYFDQSSQLWSEAGVLLATTHQIVYFKE